MNAGWLTTMKPTFQIEWLALPPKEAHQVLEKITLLLKDPHPDGNLKKQLTHKDRQLYRLESGDYRIIYTLERPYISLLALRRRKEDTYDEDFKSEYLGGFAPDFDLAISPPAQKHATSPPKEPLPEPITKALLVNLFVPAEYHPHLLQVQDEDALLECPGVPDEFKLKIHASIFDKPLGQVFQEPDYVLPDVNDLMRYKQGELLGFLLKLSPEQEKYARWGLHATGPSLLKGGPGTGKSTIALYRVRELVQELHSQGQDQMSILFTTYTNALVKSSEQLLEQLLGDDSQYVQVQTADKIVWQALAEVKAPSQPVLIEQNAFDDLLLQAIKETQFEGPPAQKQMQRQAIERLSIDYLQQEINQVIVASQLQTFEAYLAASRPGRRVPLSKLQRQAIWSVHQTLLRLLEQEKKETWYQLRSRAEKYLEEGFIQLRFDAVIVDEAQDLDPSVLRLLVRLCRTPNRLFITADANQSIYGSHFSWSDIHEELRFHGRTAILQANYRSTLEIGEAAQSYLTSGTLDPEIVERHYLHHGPLPVARIVQNDQEEAQLLASYFSAATRACKLGLDACVLLCPTEKAGRALATALNRYGLEATFMAGRYLNLRQAGIKVLTLNASKGLEFPIVALAGFGRSDKYMQAPTHTHSDEQEEVQSIDRRLLFVGMTRAMRALLIAIPAKTRSLLFDGLNERYWNRES